MTEEVSLRRSGDQGFWCRAAKRASDFWEFIDKRQIDVHLMAWSAFSMTGYVVYWSMEFVWAHPDKPGLEVGAIVGALMLPITPVMAKIVDLYFKARN
jgi:hypothetical protein